MEAERPYNFFFRFEDLRIYNKALDYVAWVYANSKHFPNSEKNGIAARFLCVAQSIGINIAEGSGRNKPQFVYYLKLAKSSIRECMVLTTICQRLGFLNEKGVEESRCFLIEMTKMTGALIASLVRQDKPSECVDDEEYYTQPNGNVL
ncbi:MAG: four helix bundle protein [Bacteroidota bacterium]